MVKHSWHDSQAQELFELYLVEYRESQQCEKEGVLLKELWCVPLLRRTALSAFALISALSVCVCVCVSVRARACVRAGT